MITTKRGDNGETDCGGKRLSKDNLLLEIVGEIDELQAILELINGDKRVIKDLEMIMGELGNDKKGLIYDLRIKQFEKEIEKSKINLDKFVTFRTKKAKELNWARTVCRRVERRVVCLIKKIKIDKNILRYFNRLSDYLFVLAIKENLK